MNILIPVLVLCVPYSLRSTAASVNSVALSKVSLHLILLSPYDLWRQSECGKQYNAPV